MAQSSVTAYTTLFPMGDFSDPPTHYNLSSFNESLGVLESIEISSPYYEFLISGYASGPFSVPPPNDGYLNNIGDYTQLLVEDYQNIANQVGGDLYEDLSPGSFFVSSIGTHFGDFFYDFPNTESLTIIDFYVDNIYGPDVKYGIYSGTIIIAETFFFDFYSFFTDNSDYVDFNNLSNIQKYAIYDGADIYDSLDGDDVVYLPTINSALNLGGTSGVAYDFETPFTLGDGTDSLYASDASADVALGSGDDTLFLAGGGEIEFIGATGNPVGTLSGNTATFGTVEGTIINNATLIAVELDGDVSGSGTLEIDTGTALSINGSVGNGETVYFESAVGTLKLSESLDFGGTISNFGQGDTLDLGGVGSVSEYSLGLSATFLADVLTIPGVATITIDGTDPVPTLTFSSDGHGGTDIETVPIETLVSLSSDVYNAVPSGADGYSILFEKNDAGFRAVAYGRRDPSSGQESIVIAFRGTNPVNPLLDNSLFKNLLADSSFVTGVPDPLLARYIADAATFVQSVLQSSLATEVTLTGHSLGGAIAQIVGAAGNFAVAAFNAPGGASLIPQLSQELAPVVSSAGVGIGDGGTDENFRITGDQVSFAGTPLGQAYSLPSPNGITSSSPELTVAARALDNHSLTNFMTEDLANPAIYTPGYTEPNYEKDLVGAIAAVSLLTALKQPGLLLYAIKNIIVAEAAPQLIDPAPGTGFTLTGDPGSPLISSITLPPEDEVAGYDLSYAVGNTFTLYGSVMPGTTVQLPANVDGVAFDPLDASGQPVTIDLDFLSVQFSSDGEFSGTLAIATDAPPDGPITMPTTISASNGSAPIPVGIPSPTDANYQDSDDLTASLVSLPDNGTIFLEGGTYAVNVGEVLTLGQLSSLEFVPAANDVRSSSTFAYEIVDPSFESAIGSVTTEIVPDNSFSWVGGNDSYTDPNAWSPTGPPGPDDNATIDQAGVIVTVTTNSALIVGNSADGFLLLENTATVTLGADSQVIVGNGHGGESSGTIVIASGSTLIDQAGGDGDIVGNTPGAVGTVTVEGVGSDWSAGGRIFAGLSAAGTLLILDGASVSATGLGSPSDESIYAGAAADATGYIEVAGTGSSLTTTGRIGIGSSGTGELEVLNGATVTTSYSDNLGYSSVFAAGNTATLGVIVVSGEGSVLNAGIGQIGIGESSSPNGATAIGTLVVANGGVVVGGPAHPGQAGLLIGYEGTVNAIPSITSTGYVTLDGLGSTLSVLGPAEFGRSGDAVLSMTNGAAAILGGDPGTTDGGVTFSYAAGGTTEATIASGSSLASLGAVTVARYGDASVLVESGGQMSAVLDAADIAAGLAGILVAESASSIGLLTVTGPGSGITTNGNIAVGRVGTGTLLIENGATATTSAWLRIGWGGTPGDYVTGDGAVTLDGTGSVLTAGTLTDGYDAGPTLAIGTGNLQVTDGASLLVTTTATLGGGATMAVDSTSGIEIGGTGDALSGVVNIDPGGSLTGDGVIFGAVNDAGSIDATPGLLLFEGAVGGSGQLGVEFGSVLELASTLGNATDVTFNGDGTLKLDAPGAFSGTIAVLPFGATIDLVGDVGATAQIIGSTLQVSSATAIYDFALSGSLTAGVTSVADDGAGALAGTDVVIACFAAGTRILAAAGEVAVEELAVGDTLMVSSGDQKQILWIGRRRIDCRRHSAPEAIWPVRVKANAFAPHMPTRDLWLSPDHSVFQNGVLIPIKNLINGRTIVQVETASVEYWHVELESHDILLAEGLPCESYLDTGNRGAFANSGEIAMLHPDFSPKTWGADACAPLTQEGSLLEAVKARLFERAEIVGGVPELALRVQSDLRDLTPVAEADGAWCYHVPAGARSLHLLSPSWIPAHCLAASLDRRRLGVRLFEVRVDGHALNLAGPALFSGFHGPETTAEGPCRWTNGDARIVLSPGVSAVSLRFEGRPDLTAGARMVA